MTLHDHTMLTIASEHVPPRTLMEACSADAAAGKSSRAQIYTPLLFRGIGLGVLKRGRVMDSQGPEYKHRKQCMRTGEAAKWILTTFLKKAHFKKKNLYQFDRELYLKYFLFPIGIVSDSFR